MIFYATIDYKSVRSFMPDVPYMFPASSWARNNLSRPNPPPRVRHIAADCGGFVATRIWGDYRYTADEYVGWLHSFRPAWAATMDWCCEDEITSGKSGIVRERQARTSAMAYQFWRDYRDSPWQWVTTIQGWTVEDYVRHAREMRPLIMEMWRHSGVDFRVGIGTLCARANADRVHQVVAAVADELPGVPLHLWGVKLSILKDVRLLRNVMSVDSAAWNGWFGRDISVHRARRIEMGLSKSQYEYNELLPGYIKKFERAVNGAKQLNLL